MAAPTVIPLTPDITIEGNYTVRLTALDPTTGAVVSGVNISAAAMLCRNVAGTPTEDLISGPYMFVPGPET